jgi:ligand-binding sensor domain-containing protein
MENHYGVAVTPDGRVWFATYGHGLAVWDPPQRTYARVLGTETGLPELNLTDIVVDNAGMLWIATAFTGIVKFDPVSERVVEYLTVDGGLPSNRVRSLSYLTGTGTPTLVIATTGGAALLR